MISRFKLFLITIVSLILFSPSCVHEDNDRSAECRQGLNIRFYSQTVCETECYYPEDITGLMLFVFDKDDILISFIKENEVILSSNFSEIVETQPGMYSVAVWAGIDDYHFDIRDFTVGNTTKNDVMFSISRVQREAASIEGIKIYYGESKSVYVREGTASSDYEYVEINMLEVTNRVSISVEGLPEETGKYEIILESDNGSMRIGGTIAEDETITYRPTVVNSDILEAEFTLLKLETGHNYTIVIREITGNTELFRGSLLGTLILKNPNVNLNCDHDFNIRFTTEDQCACGTYIIAEIWVNNWLVHSYDTQM